MKSEKQLEQFMSQWFDTQKKMMEVWQTSMSQPLQAATSAEAFNTKNYVEATMKPAMDMYKMWVENTSDLFSESIQSMGQSSAQELFSKMVKGGYAYQNLSKFWMDMRDKALEGSVDPLKFYQQWQDSYMKIVMDNFVTQLPEQMQMFFKEPMDMFTMASGNAQTLYQPWMESADAMRQLLSQSMTGDRQAYLEFLRMWNETFSSTYGQFLQMPQFGMSRDYLQKQMDSLDAFVKFVNNGTEFFATMYKVNQETMEEMVVEYFDMVKENKQPQTYKEFYKYWLMKNEAAYQKLFKTEHFGQLMAQAADAALIYKQKMDVLLEKQLSYLPLPKKEDMDSLYKTVNDLRREIRSLKREVKALKKEQAQEVEPKKAPAKKSPVKETEKGD